MSPVSFSFISPKADYTMRRQFLWQLATCSKRETGRQRDREIEKQRDILAMRKPPQRISAHSYTWLMSCSIGLRNLRQLLCVIVGPRLDSSLWSQLATLFYISHKVWCAGLFTAVAHCQLMSGNGRTRCHIRH